MPSIDFVHSFLSRHKHDLALRKCQNIKRSRASVSATEVKEYFSNLKNTLDNQGQPIPPENIFNYDETNLTDDPALNLTDNFNSIPFSINCTIPYSIVLGNSTP
jgi:hypothetical protein